jgi:hypothetical protein
MKGKAVQMAISHNFMVDSASRNTLAGMQLLKAFFEGPQDLSIAEGNSVSRRVWEGLGGAVAFPYSLSWICPLRPARYLLCALRDRGLPAVVAASLRPVGSIVDVLASRMRKSPLHRSLPRFPGKALDAATMLDRLPALMADYVLQPEYDRQSLAWLLARVTGRRGRGELRMRAVDAGADGILGWYLYYLKRGGLCQVLQIAAQPRSREEVLAHLLHDAWREGAAALTGQAEPRWMHVLAANRCVFTQGGSWLLVHARDREIVRTFYVGDAFMTRLEGEWWIGI